MERNVEKLRTRIENERIFLDHLAEKDLNSPKTIEQSQFMDELMAALYGRG